MKDLSKVKHFKPLEDLVGILSKKTQNNNPLFFRILVSYYFSKIASTMRTKVQTQGQGLLPINYYGCNLSGSGSGKGYSTYIMEESITKEFRHNFLTYTYPAITDKNLAKLALFRANRSGKDPDDVLPAITTEFKNTGKYLFSFDSGTPAAVKQMRHQLLMSKAGALNLEMDEIGSHIVTNADLFKTFLELFDMGKIKTKLIKHTPESARNEEIEGITPTNMMIFGTAVKLLDNGSKTEEEFFNMLEIGFARRCFFGYSKHDCINLDMTPEELWDVNNDPSTELFIKKLSTHLSTLADELNFGRTLNMSKAVALISNEYQLTCRSLAADMPEHETIKKTEMQHRYFKTVKLAGTFAFIEGSLDIEEKHMYQAIKLAEESGIALNNIIKRKQAHEILAKYIVSSKTDLTIVDMMDNLHFFKANGMVQKDLLTRATAYGVKNNMVIKKVVNDGVEFYSGESMDTTDLNKLIVSYGQSITSNYQAELAPFTLMDKLVRKQGMHYTAHHFNDGYRSGSQMIPGFNMVILDVDSGVSLDTARMLLKDYQAIFSTTKRHTANANRFRIIMPISHVVKLDIESYSKFMDNVFNWLPFSVDSQAKDCARKWESYPGTYFSQSGKLIDALRFIPNTNAEAKLTKKISDASNLNNLERWFLMNINIGNRNNQLIRFAFCLIDNGQDANAIEKSLLSFNKQLQHPVSVNEIKTTVMQTVKTQLNKQP